MTAATLFSGVGAPELAMPSWRWIWHAEIEKFPAAVMAHRFPHSVNLGDVTADDFCERALAIGRPDVVVFGSPCQSYSVAGKRLGLDDPRGNLALVALGIINRLRPAWFVFENVPGLLSSWSGLETSPPECVTEWDNDETSDFAAFLGAVQDIGYFGAWTVLDAQFAGVAQRRERVFFVGNLGDWRGPAAVLFEPESLCGHPPSREKARQDVTGTLGARAGRSVGAEDAGEVGAIDTVKPWNVAYAIGSHAGAADADVSNRSHASGGPVGSNISEEQAYTLRGGRTQAVAFGFANTAGETTLGHEEEQAPPITTRNGDPGNVYTVALRGREGGGTAELGGDVATALRSSQGGGDSGVRRLTPRECERLQGMPDDHTLVTYRGKPAADGPRYKSIGNNMAVPVVRWILTRLEFVHSLLNQNAGAA